MIFVISGNFRSQEIFPFEKMDVRMASRIITKNSAADPEIGINVLVRAFLKEKRGCLEVGSNPSGPSSSSKGTNH